MPRPRKSRRKPAPVESYEYIQTWLPYPSFTKSAACLSSADLATQRIHNWQLISLLCASALAHDAELVGCVWQNCPVVLQWKNHLPLLLAYQRAVCVQYGPGQVQVLEQCEELFTVLVEQGYCEADTDIVPAWLGQENYHRSHQSNLVRRQPEHYSPLFPHVESDLPYVWVK